MLRFGGKQTEGQKALFGACGTTQTHIPVFCWHSNISPVSEIPAGILISMLKHSTDTGTGLVADNQNFDGTSRYRYDI